MNPIPIVLDGDPGHDDAMAWLLAKSRSMLEILAVTTVAGRPLKKPPTTLCGFVPFWGSPRRLARARRVLWPGCA